MNLLIDYSRNELKKVFVEAGIQAFRADQVNKWIVEGTDSFDEMSNLSKQLREQLLKNFVLGMPKIYSSAISAIDETRKYILELHDGNLIECVLMSYKHGLTACISSQVGCRMGCSFCASTGIGFERNLSCGEMVAQIITMQKDVGERISNVVLMGIGEPLDNYDNLIRFLKLVNDKDHLNIGYRHISVSTCGLTPMILRLADEGFPVNLSISLHVADDKKRSSIMPVNKTNSIDKLLHGCKIYIEKTKRRITIEYALIKEFNDTYEDASKLGKKLKGLMCLVNVIPVNEVDGTGFQRSDRKSIAEFVKYLEQFGLEVTVRRELGSDISAACGQLRRDSIKAGENE